MDSSLCGYGSYDEGNHSVDCSHDEDVDVLVGDGWAVTLSFDIGEEPQAAKTT
jgi:hypothetical protein